jgi:hypothetical protein
MFWLEENLILPNVLIRGESNFDDKYVEKSVQLVRGSSFWNDLLQNPYFSMRYSGCSICVLNINEVLTNSQKRWALAYFTEKSLV